MSQVKEALTRKLFWDYSLALYSYDKVMPTCLQLQDVYKLNVNMLLFCCYLDKLSYPLTTNELHKLIAAAQQTDSEIQLKRSERRAAKNPKQESANHTQYEALKQEELVLEQQQQADIISCMVQLLEEKQNLEIEMKPSEVSNSSNYKTKDSQDQKSNLQQYQQFAVTNTIPDIASVTSLMAALNTANQTL